ncbi:hypothetical protein ACFFWD_15335 [Bradyrhizobium erythrophlei]|uniref:hypothetical protein n=1 Tax=Bradyrhizobium erythrophlei TaxID=1437360 RepID=UPI0035E9E7B0
MTRTLALCTVLAAFAAAPASAQSPAPGSFTVISPIFSQLVTFSMPSTFVAIGERTNGPSYIREAVLKGETAERWTQMITVTGAKGLVGNPKASPEAFAGSIVGGFKAACPESFAAKGFGPTKLGDQDAYVAVASCGRIEGAPEPHSESALIITVKGTADYYTLQWAERTAPLAKPVIDDAKWQERLRTLQPIRLCPIVPNERAPYPSCVGKG